VQLFEGTVAIGAPVIIDASGQWSQTVTFGTATTAHSVTAKATDLAGNIGTSAAIAFTTMTIIQGGTLATVNGTAANDHVFITSPNTTVNGAGGDDYLSFNSGSNVDHHAVTGGAGIDTLATGTASGNQVGTISVNTVENVVGSSANDTITGDANANMINGGAGNDLLNGGAGNDSFVFTSNGFGQDTITDFSGGPTIGDGMVFAKAMVADWATLLSKSNQVGADTVISVTATDTVTLKNFALANLNQNDVQIV
jgi:Ca2+-binding RTX toxin-like protein